MIRRRLLVLGVLAHVAGCGGSDAPEARTVGDLDPIVFTRTADTVTGDRIELADYADRDLVVWFWAPW